MLVRYGLDEVELDTEGAVEAKGVRRKLRSFMGIPQNAIAIVDGMEVHPTRLVEPSSTVEFVVKEGHKGIGRVFTQKEYCQLFGLTEADFEKQIQQGLKVMQTAN